MAVVPALFGLLLAVVVSGQVVDITPLKAVRRVGDDLTVLCKVPWPIDSCRMTVGNQPFRLRPEELQGDIIYSGQGLQAGECGASIKNIKQEWNGNISCTLPPQTGSLELVGMMRLIVATAPEPPLLIAPVQPSFREGDLLQVQCVVPKGRPAAKITWFLDDLELHTGMHQPVVSREPGSDLETIAQNFSRTLTADDNNKMLTCRAEHEALLAPKEARRQLNVQYPPKRDESGPITIFGLKLGAEGRLNVTVRANPKPEAEWAMADQVLTAPRQSADGQYTALEPFYLENGYYNITLILARIAKEDVDRTFYLRVDNGLAREEFSVRISTMDEPAGLELDTGAIVGIVVGVLILLVAVFLAVFAFATDRWCFAGRSHRTDIPDGADSEAPLPPHEDIKGSENPSHDHGDYISNGDTKHPEKKPDTAV